jgi:hypothetical protein
MAIAAMTGRTGAKRFIRERYNSKERRAMRALFVPGIASAILTLVSCNTIDRSAGQLFYGEEYGTSTRLGNLVENSGFNGDVDGWSTTESPNHISDDGSSRNGCIELALGASVECCIYGVSPSTTYEFGVDVRIEGATASCTVSAEPFTTTNCVGGSDSGSKVEKTFEANGDWGQSLPVAITTTSAHRSVTIAASCEGSEQAMVRFDDFYFQASL